ncbi:MAG: Ig-like domain-containing protein [Desulfobacteraceae bacterium]|nr:Ig-like domain-containing protein [Desulfobacteraceae bacterium]
MLRKHLIITSLFITLILFPVYSSATGVWEYTPADQAVDVALDEPISVIFDGEMAWNNDLIDDRLDSVTLSVQSSDQSHSFVIPGTSAAVRKGRHPVSGGEDRGWIEFSLDNPLHVLRPAHTYTAILSGAVNKENETVGPFSWNFSTQLTGPPVQTGSFDHIKSFGTVVLDATGKFYDPAGGTLTYNWSYILRGATPAFGGYASGMQATLTDLKPGFYDVLLWVENENNDTVQALIVVFVGIGPVGDLNGDGDTDGQDLIIFSGAFGQ